jgi:predicted enzyme related to lactoylglutathione lyase
MTIQNALASVAVKDLKSATTWYEKLLDAPASHPMPEVSEWRFENGGGLQVYQLAERAGSGSFTLAVDDLDVQVTRLRRLSIPADNRSDNARVKVVMIKDPEGNSIAIAQAIDPSLAH